MGKSGISVIRTWFFLVAAALMPTAAPADEPATCTTVNPSWSTAENSVWAGLCTHGTVDLAILNDQPYGMTLEQMGVSCAWDISCQRQNISKNFIREIFRNKKWRDALPNQGITIQGAWFPHGIDLRYTKLDRALRIERSLVVGTADLVGLTSDNSISFQGSTFTSSFDEASRLDMRSVQIAGSLNLQGTRLEDAVLRLGKLGGSLWVSGCETFESAPPRTTAVSGLFDVSFATIGGEFCIQSGDYNMVTVAGTRVDGQAIFGNARFRQNLELYSITVGAELVLGCSVFEDGLSLRYADVGGWILLAGSIFGGQVDMTAAKVRGPLTLASPKNETILWLNNPDSFDSGKRPRKYCFNKIDSVPGSTAAASHAPSSGTTSLILRDARFEAIQDYPGAAISPWPSTIDLQGMQVSRFSNVTPRGQAEVERGFDWYKKLLDLQNPYSPLPYQEIAEVLRRHGDVSLARDVLYERRETEREAAWRAGDYGVWFGLSVLKRAIGYGIGTKMFMALIPMAIFAFIGSIVGQSAINTATGAAYSKIQAIIYSIDLLLPVIELDREHYENVTLPAPATYYFHVHKIMGYGLAFFVIAGLSGLTS